MAFAGSLKMCSGDCELVSSHIQYSFSRYLFREFLRSPYGAYTPPDKNSHALNPRLYLLFRGDGVATSPFLLREVATPPSSFAFNFKRASQQIRMESLGCSESIHT